MENPPNLRTAVLHRFKPDFSWPWSSKSAPPPSCAVPGYGTGSCIETSSCVGSYRYYSGYCPGAANIKCCIQSNNPIPTPSTVPVSSWGLDLYAYTSVSTFACMANAGKSYLILRGFRSTGLPDTNACLNARNAVAAGYKPKSIDVYIFPCPLCASTPAQQISDLMAAMRQCSSSWSGRVWLDIEGGGQYWSKSFKTNYAFFTGLVDACKAQVGNCGVYSNADEWSSVLGSVAKTYSKAVALPVWYPRYLYNQSPSLSDFTPFGGWTKPYAKQYVGDATVCGVDVDLNYAPKW